jgi:hypothetical protein
MSTGRNIRARKPSPSPAKADMRPNLSQPF